MISSYELKSDTMKVIAEKLQQGDAVLEALDARGFLEAVKLLDKEIR